MTERLRILLSAFVCEPGFGSEPEVGFRAMLAAASQHEVWVLTIPRSVPRVRQALVGDPRAPRIHLETVDFGVSDERWPRLPPLAFQRYYDRWQRRAAVRAAELDEQVGFDLVHHVTLTGYWTRVGVAAVRKPLVWGPVGGGLNSPLSLAGALGWRGIVPELARAWIRPLLGRLPWVRVAQRAAAVALAQNGATARRMRVAAQMKVLPNALAVDIPAILETGPRTNDLLFVGRLVSWKAPILALRALCHLEHAQGVLRFFGRGPERARLERAARRWGLSERVRFEGRTAREELLSTLSCAGALIHPALHEDAGLAVAEALSLGTPVVCLDHGGPAELAGYWPSSPAVLVPPARPEAVARSMAVALDGFLDHPQPVRVEPLRPSISFERELLAAYDLAAHST